MENTKVAVENFDWAAFENESGLYNQTKEEIEKAYSDSMSNIAVGETVEGVVAEINKREVIVNIGYKSEGVIAASEFRYDADLKVGDKVVVAKYAGTEVKLDDQEYSIVRQSDILAIVE